MILWPRVGSRPVVSVSSMTWRMRAPYAVFLGSPSFCQERWKIARLARSSGSCYRRRAEIRELVCALVAVVARVTFHPQPFDLVARGECIELAPELRVLHRLL